MRVLRLLLFGLLAGVLLSLMRAPGGLDLIDAQTADASTRYAFRGAALLVIGLSMGRAARLFAGVFPAATLLAGILAGYALHGLWLDTLVDPASRLGFGLWFGVLAFGLAALGRGTAADESSSAQPAEGAASAPLLERLGLALAGAGALFAVEALLRPVRTFGMQLPQDDTVFGLVFLIVALGLGAAAFGLPLRSGPFSGVLRALALAAVPVLCLVELNYVEQLTDSAAFEGYLHLWKTDTARIGTFAANVPFGLRFLAGPAFACGAALGLCRERSSASALFVGAACGCFLAPTWLTSWTAVVGENSAFGETQSGKLLGWGAVATTAGAAACLLAAALHGGSGATRRSGRIKLVVGAVLLAPLATLNWFPASLRPGAVLPLAPQDVFRFRVQTMIDAPEGLMTVEYGRFGSLTATLDRVRLTAETPELAADELRIRASWNLLPAELRAAGRAKVLFVGQLSPDRAAVLGSLGAERVDRTATWYRQVPTLEAALFAESPPPVGQLLAPAEAKRRLAAGEYDLVIAPPHYGPTPRPKSVPAIKVGRAPDASAGGLSIPEGVLAAVWFDAKANLETKDLGRQVLFVMGGPEDLSIGVVLGDVRSDALLLPAGVPSLGLPAWKRLREWPLFREFGARRRLTERLAAASAGTPTEGLTRGLAEHFAAQQSSSPYENAADRIEVDRDALRELRDALRAHPDDPALRAMWEHLAALLVDKRMPDLVLECVEPLATEFGPWLALDRAVGRAYDEFTMTEEAVTWLQRAVDAEPYDLGLKLELTDVLLRAQRFDDAVLQLRACLAIQPGRPDLERRLGMALVRAGDESGVPLIEAALERDPDDLELRSYLETGPLAPVGPEFQIGGDPDHGHE